MDAYRSRRSLVKLVAGAGVAAVPALSLSRVAAQDVGVDSGGIGLRRADFEAAYGVGVDAQSLTIYENVTIGVPGAKVYAQYRGEIVEHLEVRWSQATQAGGIDWGTAYQAAMLLLPVDAEHRDQFWMPATPEGPVEIIGHTYESQALNTYHYNLGRILVLFQREYVQLTPNTPNEPIVPAVTLTMAEVPQ